jgi:FkbM family methyltransferase
MRINLPRDASLLLTEIGSFDACIHFSQLGEDCLLWHRFHETYSGFYVDVGAHDPRRYSNTHLLYRFRNWSGINIDADSRAINRFNMQRAQDINLNVGVSSTPGDFKFTLFQDGAVNTFDQRLADRQSTQFAIATVTTVPVMRLGDILKEKLPENTKIDYLNIDCEGSDHEVLVSNDWEKYRPGLISVELHDFDLMNPLGNKTVVLLTSIGYRFIAHYLVTSFFELVPV